VATLLCLIDTEKRIPVALSTHEWPTRRLHSHRREESRGNCVYSRRSWPAITTSC